MNDVPRARFGYRLILVLMGGGAILLFSLGIRQTFGLFLPPMVETLGWSTATLATTIALQNLLWGLAQPFASMVADRFGVGRVLVGGGLAYAAGILLTAFPTAPLQAHLGLGVLVGIGISATSFPIVLGAVARATPAHLRSRALGIASAGGSAGQFLMVPVAYGALEWLSWVGALVFLALLAGLMVPLAASLVGADDNDPATGDSELRMSEALAEAFGNRSYWLLTLGFFVCGFHVALVLAHFPAFLSAHEFPAQWAAITLGIIGFCNIPGTYLAGWLGDKISKRNILVAVYLLRAAAFMGLLLLPVNYLTTGAFAVAMGVMWLGTVPLTSGIVSQIFGPRYLSTLFGVTFMSHQIGAFFGAWSAGVVLERFGGYEWAWALSAVLAIISAVLHMPIREGPIRRIRPNSPSAIPPVR